MKKYHFLSFVFLVTIVLNACASAGTPEPQVQPTLIAEPATTTPEIFSALAPSPTPPDSTLPLTCQVTDLGVFINEEWGYCFAYPGTFTRDEGHAAEGIITLYGPGLEDSANPVRVSLEVTAQVAPPESGLTPLVDAYQSSFGETPLPIERETGMLGGKYAETLEPIPGLLSSRVVMALNKNILITLRFHPYDLELAKPDLEALFQTVTGSFAFLTLPAPPASAIQTVSWYEFGRDISLAYVQLLRPGWMRGPCPPCPSTIRSYSQQHSPPMPRSVSGVSRVGELMTCLYCRLRTAWRRSESFERQTSLVLVTTVRKAS